MAYTTYIIQDREAGNVIEEFDFMREAKLALLAYEEEDKADGTYEPNFYEIVARFVSDDNAVSYHNPDKGGIHY